MGEYHEKKTHQQHAGELFVQSKMHVSPVVSAQLQDIVRDSMPAQHYTFFRDLLYFTVAVVDSSGNPWTTIIVNRRGENGEGIVVVSPDELRISVRLSEADPFSRALRDSFVGQQILFSGLGVDFTNRRRNKVAGYITSWHYIDSLLTFSVITNESMGNCPKYITLRKLDYFERKSVVVEETQPTLLSEACRDIISKASTIFLAAIHQGSQKAGDFSDMGVNHRGGNPGFVRTFDEGDQSYVVIPDYSGNRFYQTLGSIQSDKKAGLIVPDFHTGDLLYITGSAENLFHAEAQALMPLQHILTRVKVDQHVYIREGLPLRMIGSETLSPYNPPVRLLAGEISQSGREQNIIEDGSILARLCDVKQVSALIRTFTFRLSKPINTVPGEYIVLDFSEQFGERYFHMNEANPKAVNDDSIRTWTISSAAPFSQDTNSYISVDTVDVTVKWKEGGRMTSILHRFGPPSLHSEIKISAKVVGTGSGFTCFDKMGQVPKHMIWIAGGVGFTPFLSWWKTLQARNQKEDHNIVFVYCCRGDEIKALSLFQSKQSNVSFIVYQTNGEDYHYESSHGSTVVHKRRLEESDVKLIPHISSSQVYLCGPPGLIASCGKWLEGAGVKSAKVKQESFLF